MAIVKIGDKFANLYTENKWHLETLTVLRFEHDSLTVWAVCEVESTHSHKKREALFSIGLIGQELRSGYMLKLN